MTKDNQFNLIGRNNIYLNHYQGYLVSTINFYTLMQNFTTLIKWQIVQKSNLSIEMNFEGNITSEEKELIRIGIEERLGYVLVKFNNNQFIFNGEGKINPIINNNNG
jgi:cytoskeletal protein CcmA (bactofilin family)